ncbi:MAG: VOC family protein [Pseudomonadota bacterium]
MLNNPVVQLAYVVASAEVAAERWSRAYGCGPFFLLEDIELAWGEVRDQPSLFQHTSAYGQWGSIMIELVQPIGTRPSPFLDPVFGVPPDTAARVHHVAQMVVSLPAVYEYCTEQGIAIASRAETSTGTEFAFVDTHADLGHFIEVYERSETLLGFYERVRAARDGWDGTNPVRRLG